MRIFVVGGAAAGETAVEPTDQDSLLQRTCQQLGRAIRAAGHTAVLCSPFEGSADLEVLRGVAADTGAEPVDVEMHFPDTANVRQRLEEVQRELKLDNVKRYLHAPPKEDTQDSMRYAWLLCQLNALDRSHVIIALGGKPDGASNMLLLLAEGQRKNVLPVTFLGGAAQGAYYRRRYELQDRLGEDVELLQDSSHIDRLIELAERITSPQELQLKKRAGRSPRFFISYPRARPIEADYVETLLRRRRVDVFRDETDFGAGHDIPGRIREAIHSADVFIALWCREYACSPWCFDELEMAMDRKNNDALQLWILCVDDTRIVPPRARNLVYYRATSREELEGRVLDLLMRASASPS